MRQILFLLFLSCIFGGSYTALAKTNIKQQAAVTFAALGAVQIRAVEIPKEPLRVDCYSLREKRVIATFPIADTMLPEDPGLTSEFVRFQIVNSPGFGNPIIFVIAVSPGGSDHGFSAQLIGIQNGKLAVLNQENIETEIQGGFFLSYLGKKYGYGFAAWQFIWCSEKPEDAGNCREAHYDKHRYKLTLYPFDKTQQKFQAGQALTTKRKYGGHGEGALRELGFTLSDMRANFPKMRDYITD